MHPSLLITEVKRVSRHFYLSRPLWAALPVSISRLDVNLSTMRGIYLVTNEVDVARIEGGCLI